MAADRSLPGTFVSGYVTTMRPYLLFVSGIVGAAGLAFGDLAAGIRAGAVFAAAFLSYGFGQALTDCFQIDTDALSAPYRPMTRGLLSRPATLALSVAGLTACIAVFAYFDARNLLLGLLAGTGLATYTPMKRRWWAGPWYNAGIVVILCLMARLAGGPGRIFTAPFVWTLLCVFFGYANFVLAGYFKDVAADRATGYRTFPVVFGNRPAAVASDVLALGALLSAAAAAAAAAAGIGAPAVAMFAGGTAVTVISQVRL